LRKKIIFCGFDGINIFFFFDETHAIIIFLFQPGRGGSAGGKFRISLGMPVGAVINCADNTGK
jgi:hypothetical protein